MEYVGVDGCKGGWFAVWTDGVRWSFDVRDDFRAVWDAHSCARVILVDMPVGLAEKGTRQADSLTRKALGKRCSSVFNAPVRDAVYAATKEQAKAVNKALSGKSLSEQSLGICKKILDVDTVIQANPLARDKVFEAHPELCFSMMAGAPLDYPKRDVLGAVDRYGLLEKHISGLRDLMVAVRSQYPMSVVGGDDILDGIVLALTALKGDGRLVPIPNPPEADATGLPMAVWYHDFSTKS